MKVALVSKPEYALTGLTEVQMRLLVAVFANMPEIVARRLLGVDDKSNHAAVMWEAIATGVPDLAKAQVTKSTQRTTLTVE